MKLFFSKTERIRLLGFDDLWMLILGIFPIAALGNILFGGLLPGVDLWTGMACYGIALTYTVAYWLTGRFMSMQFRHRYPEQKQTGRRLLLTIFSLLAAVVVITLLSQPLLELSGLKKIIPQPPVFIKIVMAYTIVVMVFAIYEGIYFFTKYRQSIVEKERLAKENMQTQLAVLKQQMNPHFLFNSLNTLVNIIPEDSQKATLFTQRLAAVYRRILEYRHKEMIPIMEELTALQDYIFLMQTRFEGKLIVRWHLGSQTLNGEQKKAARTQEQCEVKGIEHPCIPPHLRHHLIVPLSVQLLVENAVKHNIVSRDHPLQIDITLDENNITVSNKLRLRNRKMSSTGWGHHNLKSRYEAVTDDPVRIRKYNGEYQVSLPILAPAEAGAFVGERLTG